MVLYNVYIIHISNIFEGFFNYVTSNCDSIISIPLAAKSVNFYNEFFHILSPENSLAHVSLVCCDWKIRIYIRGNWGMKWTNMENRIEIFRIHTNMNIFTDPDGNFTITDVEIHKKKL